MWFNFVHDNKLPPSGPHYFSDDEFGKNSYLIFRLVWCNDCK